MTDDKMFSLINNLNPEDISFWTGSGISNQFPTNLPTGDILLELCMNSFMPEGILSLVKNFFKIGNFKDSYGNIKRYPRLELVIEDVVGVLGYKTFDYFSFMNLLRNYLNEYHFFFANHIYKGGTHFTMNFDNGIEAAMQIINDRALVEPNRAKCMQSRLIKIHGTITDNNKYHEMGITLKNITKGFSSCQAKYIQGVLANSKVLCFIGYGAVDAFDVIPFFHSYIGSLSNNTLKNLNVIWIFHHICGDFEPCNISEVRSGAQAILKGLEKAGSTIYPFKGNGTQLLSKLKEQWNWKYNINQENTAYDWRNRFDAEIKGNPVSKDSKYLIAGQYMAALGVGKQAVNFCLSSKKLSFGYKTTYPQLGLFTSLSNQWWRVYTNGLRDWGKHREAIRNIHLWKKQSVNDIDTFYALSRLMGEYRMRGNYIRAFLVLRKAFGTLAKNNLKCSTNPDELNAIGDFLITYLHIHRDLWKRHKICQKLLSRPWRKIISKSWVDAFFNVKKSPNPRFSTQLFDLAFGDTNYFYEQVKSKDPSLPGNIEDCLIVTDVSNFLETDSLLGDINYQREHIIDNNEFNGNLLEEIYSNLQKAKTIDDMPGIWKAYYRLSKEYISQKYFKKAINNAYEALTYIKSIEYSALRKMSYKKRLLKLIIRSKLLSIRRGRSPALPESSHHPTSHKP